MKIIDCLHIPFYEFQCDEGLVDNVLQRATNTKFNPDGVSDYFFDQNLFRWFEQCLEDVGGQLYNDKIKLKISTCWINKIDKFENIHLHHHINSIVSGIMYFSNESSGKTIFEIPNPWFFAENQQVLKLAKGVVEDKPPVIKTEITPAKGKLILFPSSITHRVTTYTGKPSRYTLAFNAFLSGVLAEGSPTAQLVLG
jgi:hypothetical protein